MTHKELGQGPKVYQKEKIELDNDIFEGEDNRRGRPECFMPQGTEVLKVSDYMEIDLGLRSFNTKVVYPLILFAVIWNSIVGVLAYNAMNNFEYEIVLFLMIFMAVGFYISIESLRPLVNRKKVIIQKDKITIEERPLRIFTKDRQYDIKEVQQLYLSKHFSGTTINGKQVMLYSLSAIMNNKRSVRIIDDSNMETVHYLEQEIERFLNIKDRKVKGEILGE